jgi:hypothetical protein
MHDLAHIRPIPGDERYADFKISSLKFPSALKNIFRSSSKSLSKSDKPCSVKEGKEGSIYSDTTTSTNTTSSPNSKKSLNPMTPIPGMLYRKNSFHGYRS